VLMCWLCGRFRRFYFTNDADGGNWYGSCDHALWSERQWRAMTRAADAK
jgi:hypothetical protein